MPDATLYGLQRKLGRYSRFTGLGFVILSSAFLILSVYDQFVLFEFDSIICFMAAIILLFRDPQARVPARVFDGMLLSSDQTIRELSAIVGTGFSYVPTGDSVGDIVLMPTHLEMAPGDSPWASRTLTPPGRGLAELYTREAGLKPVTMEALQASLPEALHEKFGLARSVEIVQDGDRVHVVLHKASVTCACATNERRTDGTIGCVVASFLAVLVSAATKRSLLLETCARDPGIETWTVSMSLVPITQVSK